MDCPYCPMRNFEDRDDFVDHLREHGKDKGTAAGFWPAPWQPSLGHPYRLQDLQPMRDRLLVAPLAVASRRGAIHLVETSHERERPQHGIVLRVGPGAYNKQTGTLIPLQARVGDCVFYGKYSGQEFSLDDRRILNMGENEVFAVLPAGTFVVVEHENPKENHLQGDWCDLCATPTELEAKAALEAERQRLVAARLATAGPVPSLETMEPQA